LAIYVIDDHPLMRGAIVMLLNRVRPGADVVELSQLSELDNAIHVRGAPELFCLDLKLPDANGISGVKQIKGMYPNVPLAVISATPASDVEDWCREAGASIYIEKSANTVAIVTALRTVLSIESPASGSSDGEEGGITGNLANMKLSKRQKQMIAMLDQGLSNRDIAQRVGISEHTVKVHLWRLFKRLGINSRTQALRIARLHGLLDL
jgi:DNA-binding NarL/FixJ family response regulator